MLFRAQHLRAPQLHKSRVLRRLRCPISACVCAAASAPSSGTVSSLESKAKTLLGLEWQYWAAIIGGLGAVLLLLFYCTKNCCPFWSWTKTLVRLAWFVLKCGCKCGWCLLKLMPRSDAPDSIRKEEVGVLTPFIPYLSATHVRALSLQQLKPIHGKAHAAGSQIEMLRHDASAQISDIQQALAQEASESM